MSNDRKSRIEAALAERLAPTQLRIIDQSHLHAGHAGAADGRGHFDVFIVTAAFQDMTRLQRHQAIYGALADMLQTDIHALRIQALTPDEAANDASR